MSYKEKNFQTEFKAHNTLTGCFELKLCKGMSIPFKNVADHQIQALLDVSSNKGLYHKLTDQAVSAQVQANTKTMRFVRPSPFDCFYLKNIPAYIVIMFYEIHKKKNVYYITINDFLAMREESTRKSITEQMAEDYAEFRESYKKSARRLTDSSDR